MLWAFSFWEESCFSESIVDGGSFERGIHMRIIRKNKRFYLLNCFSMYVIPILFLLISGSYFDFLIVSVTFLLPFGGFLLGGVYGFFCKAVNDLLRYASTVSLLVFPAVFVPNLTGSSFSDKLQTFILIYCCYFVITIFAGSLGLVIRKIGGSRSDIF